MIRSKKLALWLAATLAAAFGMVAGFASPAAAADACPLYYASAGAQTTRLVDSYGTWSDPSVGWEIKQGNTTCGAEVYTSHLIGQFNQYVYMRVWYIPPDHSADYSHSPRLVHMVTSVNNYDTQLVDLGSVPVGYSYRIQILSLSNTVGVASAMCLSYTCFYRERG